MTLIWLCIAFIAGIAAADWLSLPLVPALIVAIAAALLGLLWRGSTLALPFALLAACAFGAARSAYVQPVTDTSTVWAYADRQVTVQGTIAQQPDWNDDRQVVVVASEFLAIKGNVRAVHGLVRLQVPPVPELRYGQRIRATGTLVQPSSDGTFDFRAYLRRQSIHVLMIHPRVVVEADGRTPLGLLLSANDRLRTTSQRLLPEPHAGLLIGMLLGRQNAIVGDVRDDFRETGTSHLLVISGWNISVLAGTLMGLLALWGIGRRAASLITFPLVILYVLFTGASPAVVRAGIMGVLVLWAILFERESDAWTSLLFTCALLALIDPHVLWNIGFQLSVMGTAGLLAWAAPIERGITRLGPAGNRVVLAFARSLAPTLAALLLVTPIAVYQFGTLQVIAPLANLIVAPVVPPAMLFGMVAMVAGTIGLPVGQTVALLALPFTWWMVFATRFLASIPWASIDVPSLGVGWVWAWYGVAAAIGWRRACPHDELEKQTSPHA